MHCCCQNATGKIKNPPYRCSCPSQSNFYSWDSKCHGCGFYQLASLPCNNKRNGSQFGLIHAEGKFSRQDFYHCLIGVPTQCPFVILNLVLTDCKVENNIVAARQEDRTLGPQTFHR